MSNDSSSSSETPQHSRVWYAFITLLGTGFVYLASQIMAGVVLYLYPALRHWPAGERNNWLSASTYAQFFYVLLAEALTVAGVWMLLKVCAWSWRTIGLTKPQLKHIGLGILAVVPYIAVYMLIVTIVSQIYPSLNITQKQEIGFDHAKGGLELATVFLSLVVLPPLVEEIMMRGFMYTGLKRAFPKIVAALLVSGLFGLAHLAEGGAAGPLWIGALDTFALSLVLVYLREKTGNLWAGITLHALKNGIAFVSLFLLGVK